MGFRLAFTLRGLGVWGLSLQGFYKGLGLQGLGFQGFFEGSWNGSKRTGAVGSGVIV